MRRIAVFVGIALIVGSFLVGCNPKDRTSLAEDSQRLAKTAGDSLTNASLAGKVNGVLAVWKGVEMHGFEVQAEKGVITLDGTVRTHAEKATILEVTNKVRGVDKVVDKLKVATEEKRAR